MQRKLLRAWARARIKGLENLNTFTNFLWEKKRIAIIAVLAILSFILFWNFLKTIMIMLAFIALGISSMYYYKFIRFPFGFELNMLGIVITGKLFGTLPAIIVGVTALFFAELITERMTHSTIISFLGVIAVGFLIPAFPQDWSITKLGIIATIIYDAIIIPLYLLMGSSPARSGIFLATHIVFNVWVFTFVAPNVYQLLV